MTKKLQVKAGKKWEYVFAHNPQDTKSFGGVVLTKKKTKALGKDALPYFAGKHADKEFRTA